MPGQPFPPLTTAWGRGLPTEARLALFADVAEAVSAAHVQLVVHRDLKPGSVLLAESQSSLMQPTAALTYGQNNCACPSR